jgi:glycosyltransferase involved in cell wall biosynthesis
MNLSIVVPVYRGGETVPHLVAQLGDYLSTRYSFEIVLVDDGSPDDSAEVCKRLAEQFPFVKAVCLARNFGEHNAVMAGLNHAQGDAVVIMDDDLQNPPSEVTKLLDELARGKDVVYARYDEKRHSWFRNFGSRINDRVATIMLNKPKDLYLCSFKAMNRFLVDEVVRFDGPFPYIDGIVLRTTRRIGVVTVKHHERTTGQSGYTLRKLVSLWFRMFTGFSILPLRIASVLGLTMSGLGVLGALYFAVERLADPALPVGWATLAVLVTLLSGVQLFSLGLLGEYLGRVFLRLGGTPQFIVRDVSSPTPAAVVSPLAEQSNGAA